MRKAVVVNDAVVNVIEAPDDFDCGLELVDATRGPEIGWVRVDGVFIPPGGPPPPPASVSPLQMRRALRDTGERQTLEDFIASAPEPLRTDLRDAWEYASEIRRDDPLVETVQQALGKSSEEVDDLFRLAITK